MKPLNTLINASSTFSGSSVLAQVINRQQNSTLSATGQGLLQESSLQKGSGTTYIPRSNISTIKGPPSRSFPTQLRLEGMPTALRGRTDRTPMDLISRSQNQADKLEGSFRQQHVTVHADPVRFSRQGIREVNPVDASMLSALRSPVSQHSVLTAVGLFPDIPKTTAFADHISKVCKAYAGEEIVLSPEEKRSLGQFTEKMSELRKSMIDGHSYLMRLSADIDPADLGMIGKSPVRPMGILPVSGDPRSNLRQAHLPYFEAICKAFSGTSHPVSVTVDFNKDPKAVMDFIDKAESIAKKYDVSINIVNDWIPASNRETKTQRENASRVEANLSYAADRVAQGDGKEILVNASQLQMEKPAVQQAFKHLTELNNLPAFSHNAMRVDGSNPLYDHMLSLGTVESEARWQSDISSEMSRAESAIQRGILKLGQMPSNFDYSGGR